MLSQLGEWRGVTELFFGAPLVGLLPYAIRLRTQRSDHMAVGVKMAPGAVGDLITRQKSDPYCQDWILSDRALSFTDNNASRKVIAAKGKLT